MPKGRATSERASAEEALAGEALAGEALVERAPSAGAGAGAGAGTGAGVGAASVQLADVDVRFRSKKRDVTALSDISLDVAPGEFVAIVGPSGCGKSTLLKLVAGLLTASSGEVLLGGERVKGPRHDIGYVFQRAALLEWRSALRNILLQAEMRRMPSARARARADELIRMTGLTGFEDAYPHELSGGMQQRVALCRALLHEPPVLLMDEPFGALDALTREQLNTELNRIWRTTGTTVLLVTHSISEAVYLADRVVVMSPRPGTITEIIEVGLPAERDYGETLGRPEFRAAAARIRELLGAVSAQD
ncbi:MULTISPECIES: ABC transporter ATP-binding protein [Streptomyces]|uniref:ABC transporter ATP-binding protein n=1 Tax=Streptomyces bacillaris TaxID=68179 RepID=A0ABW6E707_9ACTN|nr:ABC transporter ATP-binding protein [Streptomyces nanshensis]